MRPSTIILARRTLSSFLQRKSDKTHVAVQRRLKAMEGRMDRQDTVNKGLY